MKTLVSVALAVCCLASGCSTPRPCLFSPLLDVENRSTPNRALAAIDRQSAPLGVLKAPAAPRGSQAVATAVQNCAGILGLRPINPFSGIHLFFPQQTPEVTV